jgi:hypothetical protein
MADAKTEPKLTKVDVKSEGLITSWLSHSAEAPSWPNARPAPRSASCATCAAK